MKHITVSAGTDMRLDAWLAEHHKETSRNAYHALIKQGNITVNKKTVKPSYRVKINDAITIAGHEKKYDPLARVKKPLDIVFENSDIIVLNKPSGLTVHPTEHSCEETLVNYLLSYLPALKNVGESPFRPGIVHRLDKLASGLMVIAKNNETFKALQSAWHGRNVRKTYLVLVWGRLNEPGTISSNIARSKRTGKMVATQGEGRNALTQYRPIKQFTNATLLEVETKTGRTHQIRAHFKSIGHPVVGDTLYKYKKLGRRIIPRMFLHAHSLTIPVNGESKTFKSPLPNEYTTFLDKLKIKY